MYDGPDTPESGVHLQMPRPEAFHGNPSQNGPSEGGRYTTISPGMFTAYSRSGQAGYLRDSRGPLKYSALPD